MCEAKMKLKRMRTSDHKNFVIQCAATRYSTIFLRKENSRHMHVHKKIIRQLSACHRNRIRSDENRLIDVTPPSIGTRIRFHLIIWH